MNKREKKKQLHYLFYYQKGSDDKGPVHLREIIENRDIREDVYINLEKEKE